jgi:hypothetical protein
MVWFVLLYLVPMFLVIGFAISLVDPKKDDDAQMLFICGILSIIPVINIITAYTLGQVLIQHRK